MLLVKHTHTDCLLQVCIEFIYRGQKKIDYTNGLAHSSFILLLLCLKLITSFPQCTHRNTAGLSSKSFFKYHSAIHDTIKGRLVPNYITKLCPILSQEFYRSLCYHGEEGEMDLMDFIRDAMFESVVRQLFGEDNVPQTRVWLVLHNSLLVYLSCM